MAKKSIAQSLITSIYHLFGKLTPEEKMSSEKYIIRKAVKAEKADMTEEFKKIQSEKVFAKIEKMPEFLTSKTILMYWSMSDELSTHAFIRKWCKQKTILLPVVKGHHLTVKIFSTENEMTENEIKVMEPSQKDEYLKKIELAIIPGVAFDKKKRRLGRGKGYYDRFLKHKGIQKWGVGFDCQLYELIPSAAFDVNMDRIITPEVTIL
jgi:5-formyltetrahydrofolate cyclo-ligase